VAVRFSVNRRGIEQVLHGEGPGGHVHNYVRRLGREGARYSRQLAPRKTGRLRAGIEATPVIDMARVVRTGWTSKARHSKWVNDGTGIYGPTGRPIRARNGKVMAFTASGRKSGPTRSGRLRPRLSRKVVVRSVRGQVGQRFMQRGLEALGAAHPELGIRVLR
jgi:hypothetical protein